SERECLLAANHHRCTDYRDRLFRRITRQEALIQGLKGPEGIWRALPGQESSGLRSLNNLATTRLPTGRRLRSRRRKAREAIHAQGSVLFAKQRRRRTKRSTPRRSAIHRASEW